VATEQHDLLPLVEARLDLRKTIAQVAVFFML
jgi:hypothetical protein